MKYNGSIELVQDASNVGVSFLKNAIIERLSSAPTGITGRLYYNTTSNAYFFYNGSSWQQLAGTTPIEFIFDSTLHSGPKKAYKITHNLNQQFVSAVVYDRTTNASYAVSGVSTGSTTFTVAGNQTSVFTAGSQFAVVGSTGNDGTYTVVSSTFGASTVITVAETISNATADGTIYVGPNQIIPQQVIPVDANNLIVTFSIAINAYVVITGITGVSPA